MDNNNVQKRNERKRTYAKPTVIEDVPLEAQSIVCNSVFPPGKASVAGGCGNLRT